MHFWIVWKFHKFQMTVEILEAILKEKEISKSIDDMRANKKLGPVVPPIDVYKNVTLNCLNLFWKYF